MTLVKAGTYVLPTIVTMKHLAMMYVFEKENMTHQQRALLDIGIEKWPKKIDMHPLELNELKHIVKILTRAEAGKYDTMKAVLREKGLDYKQVFDGGL